MRRHRNWLFEDFDSSPNTASYFVFKAATFKPRNSSIARTTAGSMDTVLSLAVNHSSMDALWGQESNTGCGVWEETPVARMGRFCRSPHKRCERLIGMGRCPDLPPSRLSLLLDRDHFGGCPKLGGPIRQVDYHALVSERENRQLAGLFYLGWSRENGHFICHATT